MRSDWLLTCGPHFLSPFANLQFSNDASYEDDETRTDESPQPLVGFLMRLDDWVALVVLDKTVEGRLVNPKIRILKTKTVV